jgi:hypothetical protein
MPYGRWRRLDGEGEFGSEAASGRWIRRGSTVVLLGVERRPGDAMPRSFLEGEALEVEGPRPLSPRWVLPDDVRAAGEAQVVRYDSPPPWHGPESCGGRFMPGAAALRLYVLRTFAGVHTVGGYDCRRNTANAAETSVHGTGRAIDVMIPTVSGRADSEVGDPIANWLVLHASAIGVQYIIWNHVYWNGSRRGRKDGPYTGPNPHVDHIHVELNNAGAARLTPWFQSSQSGASATQPTIAR